MYQKIPITETVILHYYHLYQSKNYCFIQAKFLLFSKDQGCLIIQFKHFAHTLTSALEGLLAKGCTGWLLGLIQAYRVKPGGFQA